MTAADTSQNGRKSLLGYLNDYKEYIAALAVLASAAAGFFTYFASKAQLEEARCYLYANIKYVENHQNHNNLSRLMLENLNEQNALRDRGITTGPDVNRLKIAQNDIQTKISKAAMARDKALEDMRAQSCDGES
ncbi:hypothetical protein [Roseibium sp. RKSG952]|uniref:hypothetical protein n=1 Tax=Roseibium sp. RKSG952 TaxID=2529384 RepID=UPI0012BD752F|nr:hypothetical protein [Roseibium sp. RKSG952]MTH95889.1 hypothetical protein [Roseibium sp. RKSG952]